MDLIRWIGRKQNQEARHQKLPRPGEDRPHGRRLRLGEDRPHGRRLRLGEGPCPRQRPQPADGLPSRPPNAAAADDHAPDGVQGERHQAERDLVRLGPLSGETPEYLTGEFAGDYGWDTAGFSADPEKFARYREAEVIHDRWAMLGAAGCLEPEARDFEFGREPVNWMQIQTQLLKDGGTIDYLNNPKLVHAQSLVALVLVEIVVMAQVEAFRASQGGTTFPSYNCVDRIHPGAHSTLSGSPTTRKTLPSSR